MEEIVYRYKSLKYSKLFERKVIFVSLLSFIFAPRYSREEILFDLFFSFFRNLFLVSSKIFQGEIMNMKVASQPFYEQRLKGTIAWDGFFVHCILSMIERKDFNFFHIKLISTWLGKGLTHLAHKENTHSDFFLLARLNILIAFCYLTALISDVI